MTSQRLPADKRCCVCGRAQVIGALRRPGEIWSDLSGFPPRGAATCSTPCLDVAIARARQTGRFDAADKAH